MRLIILSLILIVAGCALPPPNPYANQNWAAYMQGPPPPNSFAYQPAPQPYAGPRCYHVMANGGCAHWGP